MKRLLTLTLCAILLLCSCNDNTTTVPVQTSETEETTLSAPETTAETTTVTTTAKTTTAATNASTPIWSNLRGGNLYSDEGTIVREEEYGIQFDKAVYIPSEGIYYDNVTNPELFRLSDDSREDEIYYDFIGDCIEYSEEDLEVVEAGDKINGYTVEKAELVFSKKLNRFCYSSIEFKGNITLTGWLYMHDYDEPVLISKGDLTFMPDESYNNMPLIPFRSIYNSFSARSVSSHGFPAVYADTPAILLGNLYTDYADSAKDCGLLDVLGGSTETARKRVEITISNYGIVESDTAVGGGPVGISDGKIVSVNEIE